MRTPHPFRKLLIATASLTAFLFVADILFGRDIALIFTLSIALHEFGHYVVFRRYGYTAGMIFIPIIAAAVLPDDKDWMKKVTWEQQVKIAIAGPLVNFGLVVFGLGFAASGHHKIGLTLASFNAVLAAFNLMPFILFDGGKIFSALYNSADEAHDLRITRAMCVVVFVAFAVAMVTHGWASFYMVPLFVWGFNRADDRDDPDAWTSPRAMPRDKVNFWACICGLMLLLSVFTFGLIGDWYQVYHS